MTPHNWTTAALRTWHDHRVPRPIQLSHAALGLAGETGELVDMIKKHLYKPGREYTSEQIADELGDVLYYVIILAHLWQIDINDMAGQLFDKLADGHGWHGSGDKIASGQSDN